MQVSELMTKNIKTCTSDANLQEAAKLMTDCDCGAIPVVDNGKAVGIITDRDIACRAVAEGKDPAHTKVADCMTDDLTTVSPETTVQECCDIMEKAQVRRLLVADQEGCLCGIVSQADVARQLSKSKTAEVVKAISQPPEEVMATA